MARTVKRGLGVVLLFSLWAASQWAMAFDAATIVQHLGGVALLTIAMAIAETTGERRWTDAPALVARCSALAALYAGSFLFWRT